MPKLANGSNSGKSWVKHKPHHYKLPCNKSGARATVVVSGLALLTAVGKQRLVLAVLGNAELSPQRHRFQFSPRLVMNGGHFRVIRVCG